MVLNLYAPDLTYRGTINKVNSFTHTEKQSGIGSFSFVTTKSEVRRFYTYGLNELLYSKIEVKEDTTIQGMIVSLSYEPDSDRVDISGCTLKGTLDYLSVKPYSSGNIYGYGGIWWLDANFLYDEDHALLSLAPRINATGMFEFRYNHEVPTSSITPPYTNVQEIYFRGYTLYTLIKTWIEKWGDLYSLYVYRDSDTPDGKVTVDICDSTVTEEFTYNVNPDRVTNSVYTLSSKDAYDHVFASINPSDGYVESGTTIKDPLMQYPSDSFYDNVYTSHVYCNNYGTDKVGSTGSMTATEALSQLSTAINTDISAVRGNYREYYECVALDMDFPIGSVVHLTDSRVSSSTFYMKVEEIESVQVGDRIQKMYKLSGYAEV